MTRALLLSLLCVASSCAYDFGGGADGGAAATSSGKTTSSTDAASSSVSEVTTQTTSDTSSTDTVTATASSSAETSSASTGANPLVPCLQDDFDPFDTTVWTTFGAASAAAGEVLVVGSSGADGAYITLPTNLPDCYISTTFTPSGAPNVYVDVRRDQLNAIGLSIRAPGLVVFEVLDGGVLTSRQMGATDVDALGLVVSAGAIYASYRASNGGAWTRLDPPIALPTWFTDDPAEGSGFGLVSSLGSSVVFHDFSVVAPPSPF